MLNNLVALCTSYQSLFWIVVSSNIAIASSYFAIPITMAVVLAERRQDIPYPWLWTLFVTFIVACGMTHLTHVWSAFAGLEAIEMHAFISAITAAASVGTAVAFVLIVPQIKNLPSPKEQKEQLELQVAARTEEKDALIREINHQVGNQLQVMRSIVSIEERKLHSAETERVLGLMKAELERMTLQHHELSKQDYATTEFPPSLSRPNRQVHSGSSQERGHKYMRA